MEYDVSKYHHICCRMFLFLFAFGSSLSPSGLHTLSKMLYFKIWSIHSSEYSPALVVLVRSSKQRCKLFHITCSCDNFVWVVVHKTSYAIQDTQSVHVNLIKDYHIILAVIKLRKLISITHRYREKLVCRYSVILYVL